MKSNTSIILLMGLFIFAIPTVIGEGSTAVSHDINISLNDSIYNVYEIVLLKIDNLENITCWIPGDAENVFISINDQEISYTTNGNIYLLNLSGFNISDKIHMSVSYILPYTSESFNKEFIRPTENLSVKLDDVYIIKNGFFSNGSNIHIPLSHLETAAISWYVVSLLLLLFVLIVVVIVYALHRQKLSSVKDRAWKSQDVLETEKDLLFNLLKEIEKRYRSRKISDETYNKLKSYYKQRTVEIMKDLEDMNS